MFLSRKEVQPTLSRHIVFEPLAGSSLRENPSLPVPICLSDGGWESLSPYRFLKTIFMGWPRLLSSWGSAQGAHGSRRERAFGLRQETACRRAQGGGGAVCDRKAGKGPGDGSRSLARLLKLVGL